jgi:membrane protease YdiL (CAAX protease family)
MTPWARSGVILAVVIVGCLGFRGLGDFIPLSDDWTDALLKLVLWILPCTYLLWLVSDKSVRSALSRLGLNATALRGYGFGLVASAPMLFVALIGTPLHPVPMSALVATILVGPFAEEVLFRGWMFRQLWQFAGWPPAIAILVSAAAFGLAHLPSALPGVMSAAAAGLLFGWIVWRWGSLWPAIGLHTFMNFSWQLFGGPTLATARTLDTTTAPASFGRIATIILAIVLTFWLGGDRKNSKSTKSTGEAEDSGESDRRTL